MNIEEEYEAILQVIESSLAVMYVDEPEMSDWETKKAVDALVRIYQAEQRGRPAPKIKLSGLALASFENANAAIAQCMGRDNDHELITGPVLQIPQEAVDVGVMVACLKRIRKSIQTWTKRNGRRGYFNFVRQFLLI